jgi:hypothetical protein
MSGARKDQNPLSYVKKCSYLMGVNERNGNYKAYMPTMTEPPQKEGFIYQDQVEQFLTKQEHNKHT